MPVQTQSQGAPHTARSETLQLRHAEHTHTHGRGTHRSGPARQPGCVSRDQPGRQAQGPGGSRNRTQAAPHPPPRVIGPTRKAGRIRNGKKSAGRPWTRRPSPRVPVAVERVPVWLASGPPARSAARLHATRLGRCCRQRVRRRHRRRQEPSRTGSSRRHHGRRCLRPVSRVCGARWGGGAGPLRQHRPALLPTAAAVAAAAAAAAAASAAVDRLVGAGGRRGDGLGPSGISVPRARWRPAGEGLLAGRRWQGWRRRRCGPGRFLRGRDWAGPAGGFVSAAWTGRGKADGAGKWVDG